jgi:hypothetical protein
VHLRVGGNDEIHDGSDQRRSDQARPYPEQAGAAAARFFSKYMVSASRSQTTAVEGRMVGAMLEVIEPVEGMVVFSTSC